MIHKKNAAEIKRLFQERQGATQALLRFLIAKGISSTIAEEMVSEEGRGLQKIQDVLAAKLKVTGELSFTVPHKLVFVGPTGVGKTTTLMKLATFYKNKGKKVALITLDEDKKQSLHAWADKGGIAVKEIAEGDEELFLIDSEGCNFYLSDRVDVLGGRIAELGAGVEVILTLSAAAKEVDLYGAVHQFSSLCPASLLFTKLDETLASGVIMNVMAKTDLPIRYVAYGYPLPGEVEVAHPQMIVHKILTDFNKSEFHFLRQLTF